MRSTGDNSVTATIRNRAQALPSITIDDLRVSRSGQTINVPVRRSGDTTRLSTVRASTVGTGSATAGVDYSSVNNLLVNISPGRTVGYVPITIANPIVTQGQENFAVTISNATNGNITDNRGIVTLDPFTVPDPRLYVGNTILSVRYDPGAFISQVRLFASTIFALDRPAPSNINISYSTTITTSPATRALTGITTTNSGTAVIRQGELSTVANHRVTVSTPLGLASRIIASALVALTTAGAGLFVGTAAIGTGVVTNISIFTLMNAFSTTVAASAISTTLISGAFSAAIAGGIAGAAGIASYRQSFQSNLAGAIGDASIIATETGDITGSTADDFLRAINRRPSELITGQTTYYSAAPWIQGRTTVNSVSGAISSTTGRRSSTTRITGITRLPQVPSGGIPPSGPPGGRPGG